MKNTFKLFCYLGLILSCSGCTYLKYASAQNKYTRIQSSNPSQVNLMRILDRETYFVYGKALAKESNYHDTEMAVAAYSSQYKTNERVGTMFFSGVGTHFCLNLPEGDYQLVVFADLNNNHVFEKNEVVGKKNLALNKLAVPEKIAGNANVEVGEPKKVSWVDKIALPEKLELQSSLFYPKGSIRSRVDPIFDENIPELGLYEPASFLELAPNMFYALEEEVFYKIPVVFVHGIGGNIHSFDTIVENLDRTRYKPWYFYYPSGGDLHQLSNFFYKIFLSGKVTMLGEMPMIIVAHSMGGIVVREALNKYENKKSENKVKLFFTIASPMGGHPAAASGEKHGLIVPPAWRDLNPNGKFIQELYRKALPEDINYQLFYAFKNPNTFKLKENNDGAVPLSSQLYPPAQDQANVQYGFDATHTTILEQDSVVTKLINEFDKIKSHIPESHMKVLQSGGYDVELDDKYSPMTRYIMRKNGKYVVAMANRELNPYSDKQEEFVLAVNGKRSAKTELEKEFILFKQEFPELVIRDDENQRH